MGSQNIRMGSFTLTFCLITFLLITSTFADTKRFRRWSATPSCSYCGGQSYSPSYSSSCSYCGSAGYVAQPNPCSSGCYGNTGGGQSFIRGQQRGQVARKRLGNALQAAAGFVVGLASGGSGGCGSGGCGSGCRSGGCGGYSSGCGSGG